MPTETCILTSEDLTVLEAMRGHSFASDDPLAPILKRKIETARVVTRDDMPVNVATLSSRVIFRVNGREPDTRILSHGHINSPAGLFLSISMPRGLALLGLAEGQDFLLVNHHGREERLTLEKVQYWPEAERPEKGALASLSAPAQPRPRLKLIRGAADDQPRPTPSSSDDFDEPGPSAA